MSSLPLVAASVGSLSLSAGSAGVLSVTEWSLFNVMEYGAAGDDSTNDTTAIAAAISAAGADGGIVYLPDGVYRIGTALSLPADVHLVGAGIDVTTLKGIPAASGLPFLIQPTSQQASNYPRCTVSNLTLDGNLRAGGWTANQGGLLMVGDHWLVERVRFYDSNYFKLWINKTSHVTVRKCLWQATGGSNDNIGGGASTNILLEDLFFDTDISGNVLDVVGGSGYTLRGFYVAAQKSVFLEGVTDSIVENSYLHGVGLKHDGGYGHQGRNPRNNRILNNWFDGQNGAANNGFDLVYASSATVPITTGGGNRILNNRFTNYAKVGMYKSETKAAGTPETQRGGDICAFNVIENSNFDGTNTWGTGTGTFANAGIVWNAGNGDIVAFNHANDNRNEIQKVTLSGDPSGGTFTLTYGVNTTTDIAYNAQPETVRDALAALASIGSGNVTVGGPTSGPYLVEFVGTLANTDASLMTATSSLTGGSSPAIVVTVVRTGSAARTPHTLSLGSTAQGVVTVIENSVFMGNTGDALTGATVNIRGGSTQILSTNRIVDNPGYNPLGAATIAVTASPFTYTNADRVPEMVHIFGGTVSDVAKNSRTIANATGVSLLLDPNEAVVVTYSVAPTMEKDRH
jgi:hypothetical protein